MAYAEPAHLSIKPKPLLPPIKPKPKPPDVADDRSFDARFTAVWAGATNVLGPPVIPWAERSYAGVLDPN